MMTKRNLTSMIKMNMATKRNLTSTTKMTTSTVSMMTMRSTAVKERRARVPMM